MRIGADNQRIPYEKPWTRSNLRQKKLYLCKREDEIVLYLFEFVRGNPKRFVTGLIKIRKDDACIHRLEKNTERIAHVLAIPFLIDEGTFIFHPCLDERRQRKKQNSHVL